MVNEGLSAEALSQIQRWPQLCSPAPSQEETLALPAEVMRFSLTVLQEKLVKIGAKFVLLGRYVTFELTEFAMSLKLIWEFWGGLTSKLTLCFDWRQTALVKFGR